MPAKRIKKTLISENPWYSFFVDDLIWPNGKPGKYYYIENNNAVMILAIDEKENLHLVEQMRYVIDVEKSLELASGGIEKNEEPLTAAKRELKEELGLEAQELISLGYSYPCNGYSTEKLFLFLARGVSCVKHDHESTEVIKMKKIPLAEIVDNIRDNIITDQQTIAAIYKYILWKETEKK